MKAFEIFNLIKSTSYVKSGNDVDWCVLTFPEEKRIRLIFQESDGKIDWHTNFDFPIKPYKKQQNTLWLHRGWAKAWKSCNDVVSEAVINCMKLNPTFDVEICGWSYGGAMALIAVEDLGFRTGRHDFIVTTFGGPKPLFGRKTQKYVASYIKEIHQYTHRNDIVTYVPPFLGYRMVKRQKVGKKTIFGLFNPWKYHTMYGNESLYS